MEKPRVIHSSAFIDDALRLIVESARGAVAQREVFRIALSGGNTPREIYAQLARIDLPWDRVVCTFGDERCVPPDDAQSNYKMAKESLLDAVKIPRENVLRIRGELAPDAAAEDYEKDLAAAAAKNAEPRYVHDLLLLGLGPDGHTASLFPDTAALSETEKNVVANFVPKFSADRITFTYPLINAARHVCFLVKGREKSGVVDEILAGGATYPAARVQPTHGLLTWLLDF